LRHLGKDEAYNEEVYKATSNDEPLAGFNSQQHIKLIASADAEATQDEPKCNQCPQALFFI
jgi:hypothetical protein